MLDVDGVIVDSPHEVSWRAALAGVAARSGGLTATLEQGAAMVLTVNGKTHDLRLGTPIRIS